MGDDVRIFMVAAVLPLVAMLAACAQKLPTKSEYELSMKAVAESPTLRKEVVAQCETKLLPDAKKKYPQVDWSKFLSVVMAVPEREADRTLCVRLVDGFAKGRITYEELKAMAFIQ